MPQHTFVLADVQTNALEQTVGTLAINGNYTQEVYDDAGTDRIGTLRIKVSGDHSDTLSVDGNIALVAHNGVKPRLEIVIDGPVTPFKNFNILDWTGSFTGEFDVVLPESPYIQWDLTALYTQGVILSRTAGTCITIAAAN